MSSYEILKIKIRHNTNLPEGARLLYADIVNLVNQEGYTLGTNAFFAKSYKKSNRCIQGWVNKLKELGYISIEMKDNNIRIIKLSSVMEVTK